MSYDRRSRIILIFFYYAIYNSRYDHFVMNYFKYITYERLIFSKNIYELNARLIVNKIDLN